VRTKANAQIKIAGLRTIHAGTALSGEAYSRTVAYAGRNIHFNRFRFENLTRTAARWASLVACVAYEAGAITSRASFCRLHLQCASTAAMRLFQRKLQLGFDIVTPVSPSPLPTPSGASSPAGTEHFFEDVEASALAAPTASKATKVKAAEVEPT
jgi:hypothetical protein